MSGAETKACHNCRRKRLKCDKNVPICHKCVQRGDECLGYQSLFRWDQGLASRGKLRGATFESLAGIKERSLIQEPRMPRVVTDTLLQDLCNISRKHISYFATNVCPDLVLYDEPYSNPFRELLQLIRFYPCLLQIMLATSALHMSNASQGHLTNSSFDITHEGIRSLQRSDGPTVLCNNHNAFVFTAKQQALGLLSVAIGKMGPEDLDGILATVLLFVQFEIMDTGQSQWRYHIRGARSLIDMIHRSESNTAEPMSALRRCLVSNCLVYDIFGTTFTPAEGLVPSDKNLDDALSLLRDAQGNHCSSFPVPLICLIQDGIRLSESDDDSKDYAACIARDEQAHLLIESARGFNPYEWATNVQIHSLRPDLVARTHIACAHQAATCIYLIRLLWKKSPPLHMLQDLEDLAHGIRIQLSSIPPNHSIVAATAWPSFIAGAEATDEAIRGWALSQFQNIWAVQPWGLVKRALTVLDCIWARGRQYEKCSDTQLSVDLEGEVDWVTFMKRKGVDWLIL